MKITFEKLYNNAEELKKHELLKPEETAALVVNILTAYTPETKDNFYYSPNNSG